MRVVDDEAGLREVIGMGLRRCAVTAVASGREALDAIGAQSFDVVLLDLVMPDLSGMER